MSAYNKPDFEPINSQLLDKVTGGSYGDFNPIISGQVFCPDCQKSVTAVKGSDGQTRCPDCGTVIPDSFLTSV